jgi:hypothetical protein
MNNTLYQRNPEVNRRLMMVESTAAVASAEHGVVRQYILEMIAGLATMAAEANQMDLHHALLCIQAVSAGRCYQQQDD